MNAANAFRAVPTLALLTLLAIQPAISLKWNGFLAAWLALTALAIPPILTNTYVGMREVDADVRDAAKAMGLTGGQVLRTVEAPLAVPFVMAGVRTACIEVVATSTLAAYVSYTDLGTYVITGLNTNDSVVAFSGALLVAAMAGSGGAGTRPADQGFDAPGPCGGSTAGGPPVRGGLLTRPHPVGALLANADLTGQDFPSPTTRDGCAASRRDETAVRRTSRYPACASRVHSLSEPSPCWPPRSPSRPRRRPPRAPSPPS